MKRLAIIIGCVLLGMTACKKEEEQPEQLVEQPTTTETATAVTPPAAEAMAMDLPVEQDFEEQAGQEITAQNLESELDKVEKEIAAP